jgi:Carbon starvation protein, predicted membrane protein
VAISAAEGDVDGRNLSLLHRGYEAANRQDYRQDIPCLVVFALVNGLGSVVDPALEDAGSAPNFGTVWATWDRQSDPPGFHRQHLPMPLHHYRLGCDKRFSRTQSPLMARCQSPERKGRPIFYGAMITEGMVALVWATVAMWFFYDAPQPGYEQMLGGAAKGFHTSAPMVVNLVCNDWLGVLGGILAMLGVVAAPITSGDTAFRSARLIVAQALKINQLPKANRLYICIPLFVASFALLIWQISNPDGFNTIWQYFGWANQTLSVFTL